MFSFDASKDWVVLISPEVPAAKKAGEELAHYIELLRKQAGLIQKVPIQDTSEPAPHDYIPQILLTTTGEGGNQNGFSWRAGNDRIEICGVSGPGLREGVFDFLSALGIGWPERTRERLPPPDRAHPYVYDLRTARANAPSGTGKIRRRRLIFGKFPLTKNDVSWIIWAARNKADAVVLPLRDDAYSPELSGKSSRDALVKTAEQYGLIIERGGWDLSLLVPRRLFRSNRELFRMDRGKRKKD
ncbi:MAG: hypothetical protein LBP32_06935, partial [Spirochaetaceae bacterium]|nr:hypothetical protein [Spirochaetaceae bacterium]